MVSRTHKSAPHVLLHAHKVAPEDQCRPRGVMRLSRPGGNITGVTVLGVELGSKRLEVLHELIPTADVMAALVNPSTPAAETQSTELQAAARRLGLKVHVLHARTERDFDTAFEHWCNRAWAGS